MEEIINSNYVRATNINSITNSIITSYNVSNAQGIHISFGGGVEYNFLSFNAKSTSETKIEEAEAMTNIMDYLYFRGLNNFRYSLETGIGYGCGSLLPHINFGVRFQNTKKLDLSYKKSIQALNNTGIFLGLGFMSMMNKYISFDMGFEWGMFFITKEMNNVLEEAKAKEKKKPNITEEELAFYDKLYSNTNYFNLFIMFSVKIY